MEGNIGPSVNRAIWPLTILASLFFGLRIYCKIWRRRSLWWDDYFLLASWVALVVSTSLQSTSMALGLGNHTLILADENIRTITIYSYISGFFTILAAMWAKASFALTLLRISNGYIRYIVWFILITVNLIMGAAAVMQWVQCWPIAKLWDQRIPGTCLSSQDVQRYDFFMSIYSGVMDIVLALLPWRIIWHVQISKKEKYGALFAMSMGIFAGISSILKIAALFAIGNADMATTAILFIFGTAEAAITIMAISIPVLRALMQPPARPRTETDLSNGSPGQSTARQRLERKEKDLEL